MTENNSEKPPADPNFAKQMLLGFLLLMIMIIGRALTEGRP